MLAFAVVRRAGSPGDAAEFSAMPLQPVGAGNGFRGWWPGRSGREQCTHGPWVWCSSGLWGRVVTSSSCKGWTAGLAKDRGWVTGICRPTPKALS